MRKKVVLLFMLVCLFALVGCGNNDLQNQISALQLENAALKERINELENALGSADVSIAIDPNNLIFRGIPFGMKYSEAKNILIKDLGAIHTSAGGSGINNVSYKNVPITEEITADYATYVFESTNFDYNEEEYVFVKGLYTFRGRSEEEYAKIINSLYDTYGDCTEKKDAEGKYQWRGFNNNASLSAYPAALGEYHVEYVAENQADGYKKGSGF